MPPGKQPTEILANLDEMLPELEALYKDVHAHPELSMEETRTAGIAAEHLKKCGFEVRQESARPALSVFCTMGTAPPSCCGLTWMLCPSRKPRVCLMPAQ